MGDTSGFQLASKAPLHYGKQGSRFMSPFVEALVGPAVHDGDDVLDVACGTGFATRAAAHAAGPSGKITGSDLNPSMVAMARSIRGQTPTEIDWHEASALDLPFSDRSFDSVISQQGIQFFPEVEAGG